MTEITELVKKVKWWPLCICYWWFYTSFFPQVTVPLPGSQLSLPNFGSTAQPLIALPQSLQPPLQHTPPQAQAQNLSRPAQVTQPFRGLIPAGTQHSMIAATGKVLTDKSAVQKLIWSVAVCYPVEPPWQPVMTFAFRKHSLTLKVREGKTGKPAMISSLVTECMHLVKA